jgi:hypothetical protein
VGGDLAPRGSGMGFDGTKMHEFLPHLPDGRGAASNVSKYSFLLHLPSTRRVAPWMPFRVCLSSERTRTTLG